MIIKVADFVKMSKSIKFSHVQQKTVLVISTASSRLKRDRIVGNHSSRAGLIALSSANTKQTVDSSLRLYLKRNKLEN